MAHAGLGAADYELAVCIANRPPLEPFSSVANVRPLRAGDIQWVVSHTGNHWRKIFTLYAKLGFALNDEGFSSWQAYREGFLLSAQSRQVLLFSPPRFAAAGGVTIISGKTYAESLGILPPGEPLEDGFFVRREARVIVAPYFDYRQLTNARLALLVDLVQSCRA